jgi:hypothetical protein
MRRMLANLSWTARTVLATSAIVAVATTSTQSAEAQEKFALQLFHFNLQYVCGGTIGFTGDVKVPELDLDNDQTEDRIITESFEPIVDLFEKHPTWGVDLEMQGYMLDVIAARHPALLAKMRPLAASGQIDINSFHYSDQLFIAYPQEDWERSQDLTVATFAKHDIVLSKSVFCQEGQAAPAMAQQMADRGYRTMAWPKNLWSFQHGDNDAAPLYTFGDIVMVQAGKGVNYDDGTNTIDMTWTFFDDGELLATGDFNPYFTEFFLHDPAAVAEYENKLLDLEADGYVIATIDQYVDTVENLVTPVAPPPLLDGTWQPNSTNGVSRWLGRQGVWAGQERDNHVRTVGAQAHRELVAAEAMAMAAGIEARAPLDAAWRLLFLGQVTDASGINPFRGEIQYGMAHMTESMRIARDVIREGKQAMGLSSASIDPASGSVGEGESDAFAGAPSEAPLKLVTDPGDREVSETWELVGAGHWRVVLTFGAGEFARIAVTFPGELEDDLTLGLSLDDATPTTLSRSEFSFETFHFALPTGYIGLGGGRWVVKDMAAVHVAAEVKRDSADVLFIDETADPTETQRWVFHVLEATPEDAAASAIAVNAARRLVR